jgi:hypothetical protein
MFRPHEPFFHRNLLRLLFVLVVLWLPRFAIAMPPMCGNEPCESDDYCGNGVCTGGESCSNCSDDCGACPVNTGDGHPPCDGWDRQGACALPLIPVSTGTEFRRFRGGHDSSETYLTSGYNGSGFNVSDGSVGIISTSPLPGQIPLHHYSSQRGYIYDLSPDLRAHDYVYRGIAAYVWPPGSNQGFPLYRTFSSEYGYFYTNFPSELRCQLPVTWQPFLEIARVNWPAPFFQADRKCYRVFVSSFPNCDPFAVERCRQQRWRYDFNTCRCEIGIPG